MKLAILFNLSAMLIAVAIILKFLLKLCFPTSAQSNPPVNFNVIILEVSLHSVHGLANRGNELR